MGKKIAVIGDVHCRTDWQKIKNLLDYDRIIFMGDYFDPYEYNISYDERLDNFEKILQLKKENPHKVILLFGNHDLHYLPEIRQKYGRYDNHMAVHYKIGERFEEMLKAGTLQIAYTEPGTDLFFIHSTLSAKWYNLHVLHKNALEAQESGIIEIAPTEKARLELEVQLNNLNPLAYDFSDVYWDVYGYDESQGPLWWRCMNQYGYGLQEGWIMRGITQVNGHTQRNGLETYRCKSGCQVVLVDILGKGKYTEIVFSDLGNGYDFVEKNIYGRN